MSVEVLDSAQFKIVGAFACYRCGYRSRVWAPRCPSVHCRTVNGLVRAEEVVDLEDEEPEHDDSVEQGELPRAYCAGKSKFRKHERIAYKIKGLDDVLGGGAIVGNLYIVTGYGGGGKSTLLLKMAIKLSSLGQIVYHVDFEEPKENVLHRCREFFGASSKQLMNLHIIDSAETIDDALKVAKIGGAQHVFVNSIQEAKAKDDDGSPFFGEPGDPRQLKKVTLRLMKFAHREKITVWGISQVKDDGEVLGAGQRATHRCDALLRVDKHEEYDDEESEEFKISILSTDSGKNRFADDSVRARFRRTETGDLEPLGVVR